MQELSGFDPKIHIYKFGFELYDYAGVFPYNFNAAAAILYIDEMDNVFIEWSDGKLSSFSDKQVLHSFGRIA